MVGARGQSAIVTLVDRASRFNIIGDLPGGHGAENVLACCIELFERVSVDLRRSLTWDSQDGMSRGSRRRSGDRRLLRRPA
jgi:IS30 family transposase